MGGSLGKSKNQGSSQNQYSNNVFGPQGEALGNLYNMALQHYGNAPNFQGQIADQATQASNQAGGVFDPTNQAYKQQLQGGAYGDSADVRQKLMDSMGQRSNMGSMYESIVGGQGNEYIDPLIDRMRSDSAQNVSALQGGNALDAAAMGQSGSSRHAMENAMVTNQANRDLMSKEAELRAGGYDKDLAMKMNIARQADTGHQAEQDRLMQMLQGSNQSQSSAIGQGGLMQALSMGGMAPLMQAQQAGWNPLNNLANILGPAIMEGKGSGSGSSKGKGFGSSGGLWGS